MELIHHNEVLINLESEKFIVKRYIRSETDFNEPNSLTPADFVERNRIRDVNAMQVFDINGVTIKTNYGSDYYPMLSGNANGYHKVPFESTDKQVFNELVSKGYTKIRFAELSTRVRGYHWTYYKATF